MGETSLNTAYPWPTDPGELVRRQAELARERPEPWSPLPAMRVGGCFVCFERCVTAPGNAGDPGWAAAVTMTENRIIAANQVHGTAGDPYEPGLLAAREGPLLQKAVGALAVLPDVLLVNATGRDHPRQAGLALHVGWVLDLPTVGVTHRPLLAYGDPPGPWAGSHSPLWIDSEQVGWWLRTRLGARPIAVSPGWRIDLDTALDVVLAAIGGARTPEPIRQARRLAREARSRTRSPGTR